MYGTDGEVTRPATPGRRDPATPGRTDPPAPGTTEPPPSEAVRDTAVVAPRDTGGAAGEGARHTSGDERVDAAIARLRELDGVPTAAHPEIFQDVHRRLQEALTGIDGEQQ